ncbi:hypothetical protein BJY52DRAFT_526773 [Lactarius psammicola]|nr:hypothetical protein BJY52DRAFT_526773 [Lactarius psammicola]
MHVSPLSLSWSIFDALSSANEICAARAGRGCASNVPCSVAVRPGAEAGTYIHPWPPQHVVPVARSRTSVWRDEGERF